MSIFIVRAKKIVTVSDQGTIVGGAMVIQDGKIIALSNWKDIQNKYNDITIFDFHDSVICPSLVDCHTHLLEFAPPSQYPITNETHLLAGKAILLNALCSGITALGEQICGNPMRGTNMIELRQAIQEIPIDISFATTSISIGFQELAHFTSVTGSLPVDREVLVKKEIIEAIAEESGYGGENIFINATPANFTSNEVPNAGLIIYSQVELNEIVSIFHSKQKKIGTHVAGELAIDMALEARFDILHHAHGITDKQIKKAAVHDVMIVATPLGGTHIQPNSIEEVMKIVDANITVAISTDAYLPPHEKTVIFPKEMSKFVGPEALMAISHPYMQQMLSNGYDENKALAFLTINPAKILGKEKQFGSLTIGKDANFIVADGVPGLEIYDTKQIKAVYFQGKKVVSR